MADENARDDDEIPKEKWGYYLLLVIPFIGMLWVPFYNSLDPDLGGVPFFYWYQFLWIGIGAALTAFVYFATRKPRARRP